MYFLDFCSHVWLRNVSKKKSAENFPCGLLKTIGFAGEWKAIPSVQALFGLCDDSSFITRCFNEKLEAKIRRKIRNI